LPSFFDFDEEDEHTTSYSNLPSFIYYNEDHQSFYFAPVANITEVGLYYFFITVSDNNTAMSTRGITYDTLKVMIIVSGSWHFEEEYEF